MSRDKLECNSFGTRRLACAIFVALFCAGALHGDIIYLKNGRVVNGAVRHQTLQYMLVRTENRLFRIRKRDIRKIVYGVSPFEQAQKVKRARNRERRLARDIAAARADSAARARELRKKRARLRRLRRERARREAELRRKRLEQAREEARRRRIRRLEENRQNLVRERRELISGDERIRRSFAVEQKQVKKQERAITTFRGALTRSLILPGLGQYYRDQKLKGGLFMGTFALLAWNYSRTRADYNSIRATSAADIIVPVVALQDRAILVNAAYSSIRADEISAARAPNQQALYLLLGFWAYNIFDLVYLEPEPADGTTAFSGTENGASGTTRISAMISAAPNPGANAEGGGTEARLAFRLRLSF